MHVIVAFAVGLAALGSYAAWYAVVSSESQHVADLQAQIDAANKNASRIAAARIALSEIADDEATVQGYFVPEAGVVSFINNLEQMGTMEKSDVSVLSVSAAGTSTQAVLLLTLSITGTFDAVMRTVGLVEYAPYDLFISRLSVTQLDKNSWQASVSLSVGSAPPAPQTPAAASTTARTSSP